MDTPQEVTGSVRQETKKKLRRMMYGLQRTSDPETMLRRAGDILGRRHVKHADIDRLTEADAQRLIEAFDKEFPEHAAKP